MKTLRMAVMLVLLTFAAQAVFAQADSNCKIKGFITKDGKRLYLVPGHKLYDKIQINTEGGEQWFCTAEEAQKAGFAFVPDPNNPQLRPATKSNQAAVPTTAPKSQQQAKQTVAPAEQSTPEQQPAEQAVTEQPPAETPQEQPVEIPAQTEPESQPTEMSPTETAPEISQAQMLMMFAGAFMPILLFTGAILLIMIIAWWKIFTKAGKPGWTSLIPIYNIIVLIQIAGMPLWSFLGMFIPMVNVIVWFIICLKLAQSFGKGAGYALGFFFLPFIFYPMLAFGSAEYNG